MALSWLPASGHAGLQRLRGQEDLMKMEMGVEGKVAGMRFSADGMQI